MMYFAVLLALFGLELLYFHIADHFNIIDKPNHRSSHSTVTLRGGGIIFYFAVLIFFLMSGFEYPWFFLGLSMMTLISFFDDIFTLNSKIRLVIHFLAVLLVAYQLSVFEMPWIYLFITFIVFVGGINAYNFMDGINGITASYSLAVGLLLSWVNIEVDFIDQRLLSFSIAGVLVFGFFNFRSKAKCFAGDVGSVAIGYIYLYCLSALILKTSNLSYILFLAVYGVDTIWTIIHRLYLKENIFEAHRTHLYQYLSNEVGINKLLISFMYGVIQLLIGISVLFVAKYDISTQILFSVIIICVISAIYLFIKNYVYKKYVRNH